MILLLRFINQFGMRSNKTAILLSGGMDSIAIAYWKKPDIAITIDYGQKCAEAEIQSAAFVAKKLGLEHHIIRVDCSSLGSGCLLGSEPLEFAPTREWWPYRNQLLVTLACMKAISLGVKTIFVGSIKQDGDRHKDGTKEFYNLLSLLIEYQEGGINIDMPAADLNTIDIIKRYKVPLYLILHSHSCHTANIPCLDCPGCVKNYKIRQALGIG